MVFVSFTLTPHMQRKIRYLGFSLYAACICSGILAGGNLDRYIVQVPAWRRVDVMSWLAYSRHADLGNGLIYYPLEAIGAFIFLLTCSCILLTISEDLRFRLPLYSATLFAVLGLVFTAFAAPVMLSLRTIPADPATVQKAFDRFHFWGLLRAIAQVLSFIFTAFGTLRFVGLKNT
jgi:hypothetical protein